MTRSYPGSTLGVNSGGQAVIPRRFKRKNFFVTDAGRTHRWTDRRDGRNSDVHGNVTLNKEGSEGKVTLGRGIKNPSPQN